MNENNEVKLGTIEYADDEHTSLPRLIGMRLPPLAIGFVLGILLPFIISRFEELLTRDIRIAFFIPFIIYMADAVATQTESIYIRDLKTGKASFKKYLLKESFVGLILGLVSGVIGGIVAFLWFKSMPLAYTVAFGMLGAIVVAPIVALTVVEILELEHTDPAVGSGPIATVIQDSLSILIFGLIASVFFL
ncbi:MAG: magnesium transporter [bacterium]|nr:magnesium transporter [bacterium]